MQHSTHSIGFIHTKSKTLARAIGCMQCDARFDQ